MNEVPRRLIDRIVDPTYAEGYQSRPIEELRIIRDECREGENELSFERRLCQARIDILSAELDHRAGRQTGDLMSRLPEILADEERGTGSPLPDRAPDLSIPRNMDIPRVRVDEIIGEQTLARLSQVPSDEIKAIIESLGEHERKLSAKRRQVHDVLDRIQEEIVRRYTSGEADPAALLR
jgi:anti-sigma-K factor RsiG